ncbi:hypothetical protein [Methylobacterium radiodurans]|uniref:Uncharacterized protein n=1 Tax=Methylobacterium radiodurans TaxID=2202828 RepID=A0A2U8VR85_9HYPH|nr:hypothetical protein [Methylobacterium radiodurans]AWN35941.1 hypothetical protein DK427_09510 [Methylobacterium radiodurans]
MKARASAPGSLPGSDVPQPWSGVEPEDLEAAARILCTLRPGSRAAEWLMERATYLRAMRSPPSADLRGQSALLLA